MFPEGQADHTLCGGRGRDQNRSAELHREGETKAADMMIFSLLPLSPSDSESLIQFILILSSSLCT
jgi:hypothetical protein